MWHFFVSSSSRDSLSHYMSTGICHCTNVTAQLVSSGWPARAPHLSPVAAGAAVSIESKFFVCFWSSLPEITWSRGGHSMRAASTKVWLSQNQFKLQIAGFRAAYDNFRRDILFSFPPSSIIPESPVMIPDIQWSYGCESSLKMADFHIRSRSEPRTWL